jgi:hypothetical protein
LPEVILTSCCRGCGRALQQKNLALEPHGMTPQPVLLGRVATESSREHWQVHWGIPARPAEGPAVIEETPEQVERTEERWPIAEFLRIKCELLLLKGAPAATAAAGEDHFRQALEWARRQGAVLGITRGHEPCPVAPRPGPPR